MSQIPNVGLERSVGREVDFFGILETGFQNEKQFLKNIFRFLYFPFK